MSDFLPEPNYEDAPSTITVEIGGEERPWYLGAKSFEIARDNHGLEPDEVLAEVQDDAPVESGIERVSRLVWTGFLVFAPELEVQDVKAHVPFPPPDALIEPITEHLNQMPDDQLADLGKEAAESA